MYGYIFFEVDEVGQPLYGELFQEVLSCKLKDTVLLLSKEYRERFTEKLEKENVIAISDLAIANIDDSIEESKNRGNILSISRNTKLEEWLRGVITAEHIQVMTSVQKYVSINHICKQEMVLQNYLQTSTQMGTKQMPSYMDEVADGNDLKMQVQQQAMMIHDLKNEIQDKRVYIDSILTHATNLDNELKKYKNWYEQSPKYGEKVENLEKINEKCTALYKETLEKMDALLVENLELKKKYKVK